MSISSIFIFFLAISLLKKQFFCPVDHLDFVDCIPMVIFNIFIAPIFSVKLVIKVRDQIRFGTFLLVFAILNRFACFHRREHVLADYLSFLRLAVIGVFT